MRLVETVKAVSECYSSPTDAELVFLIRKYYKPHYYKTCISMDRA